jgi:hypothetical protein
MYNRSSCLSSALALFGAYCIAYVLHLAGHEGGHALVLLLTDGSLKEYVLNPFGTSYVAFDKPPSYMVFTILAGIFYGTLLGLLVWLLTLRMRGPFWLPLRLYGMLAPAENGLYLLTDSIFGNGSGDGSRLVVYGVSWVLLVVIALGLLLLSLVMALHLQSAMGIDPTDSFGRRLGILWGGFLPYMALEIFYLIPWPRDLFVTAIFWLVIVLPLLGFQALLWVLPFVCISGLIQTLFHWPDEPAQWMTGFHAYILFLVGLATVVLTLYIFRVQISQMISR